MNYEEGKHPYLQDGYGGEPMTTKKVIEGTPKELTLADVIQHERVSKPPRIVFYSLEGMGKSTFGASAIKPIFQPTEDGLDEIDAPKFPKAESFPEVMANIKMLGTEEHDFKTYILDTMDWLEPLVIAETCDRYNMPREYGLAGTGGRGNAFGYGNGVKFAMQVWEEFLVGLGKLRDRKGMATLLIAHSEVKRFESPDVEPYDRYQIKLHKDISAKIIEWCDALLFANYKVYTDKTDLGFNKVQVRGVGGTERVIYTEEHPAYKAKNRYDLPPEIPFIKGEAWNALMMGIKASRVKNKK